jgi:hypothetical protein
MTVSPVGKAIAASPPPPVQPQVRRAGGKPHPATQTAKPAAPATGTAPGGAAPTVDLKV